MTNFVKDRPNGELEKSESTQIQRALVLAIVDGGKDYATVSGTLGLMADVLPYLPLLSPVWEDITEIELNTTLQPSKIIYETMRGYVKSRNIMKVKVQEERDERAAKAKLATAAAANLTQKSAKAKAAVDKAPTTSQKSITATKQEEPANPKPKVVVSATTPPDSLKGQSANVEAQSISTVKAKDTVEKTPSEKPDEVDAKWLQYKASKRKAKQDRKEWMQAIKVMHRTCFEPSSESE